MHFDVLRFKSWTWRHSDASGYSSWHLDAIASAPGASAQGGLGMCKAQFSANRENQVLQAPDFHRLSLFPQSLQVGGPSLSTARCVERAVEPWRLNGEREARWRPPRFAT